MNILFEIAKQAFYFCWPVCMIINGKCSCEANVQVNCLVCLGKNKFFAIISETKIKKIYGVLNFDCFKIILLKETYFHL